MSDFDKNAIKLLLRFGVAMVVIFSAFFFFKYLLAPLLPFLLAWMLSALVRPFATRLWKRTRLSYKFWCILLLAIFSLLLFFFLWLIISALIKELSHFINSEEKLGEQLSNMYSSIFELIKQYFPRLYSRIDKTAVTKRLFSVLSDLSLSASMHLARFAFTLPEVLLFVVITYLSAYYITVDQNRLTKRVLSFLPQTVAEKSRRLFGVFLSSLKSYFKAGGLLLAITFSELFAGFFILRLDFPFLFALVVAAIDFLPVLGTGTVLIPWGTVLFLMGARGKGIGILILWLTTVLSRQIAEPRILGKSLGVHPLLTLFATYFGLKFFGVWGMLLFPIGLSVAFGMVFENKAQKE